MLTFKNNLIILLFIILLGLSSVFAEDTSRGTIDSPITEYVSRQFTIHGTADGKYRNLWLVERIGMSHWPKEPQLRVREKRWDGVVFEGGYPPQGRFEIVLMDVSDETSRMFKSWLEQGHRTGSYPGIPESRLGKDAIVLDSKNYRLKE